MNKQYVLVTLGGCLMGLSVLLVVVLMNPEADNSASEVIGLAFGAALLGGAMTFVRYYSRNRAQAAGKALRKRHDGSST